MVFRRAHALAALAVCSVVGTGAMALIQDEKPPAGPPSAEIDKAVADFKLRDIAKDLKKDDSEDANLVRLADFKDKKAAVLFFMSEKCSVTWRYEKRVGKLMQDLAKKDVAFAAVRCSAADTPESIRKFAETRNFAMPILNDEKGEMTKYFKVRNTPAFVVIDKKGMMRFKGGFDDNPAPERVKNNYLADAIAAVLDNREVATKQSPVFG